MHLQERFFQICPGGFFLEENDQSGIQMYLADKRILEPGENLLSIEKAGPGNMNCVLRVHTPLRTLILRQGRPWIEKQPEKLAPGSRMENEVNFYKWVKNIPAWKASTPHILLFDKRSELVIMEDLGAGKEYSWIYQEGKAAALDEMCGLAILLSSLHNGTYASKGGDFPANDEIRKYILESLFPAIHPENLPQQPDSALEAELQKLKQNQKVIHQLAELRDIFNNDRVCLQHGDFSPGSWLKTEKGMFVIDPEFAFFGPTEFDMGTMLAHLVIADQDPSLLSKVIESYEAPPGFSTPLMWKFAGLVIIRFVFGLMTIPNWNGSSARKITLLGNALEMLD